MPVSSVPDHGSMHLVGDASPLQPAPDSLFEAAFAWAPTGVALIGLDRRFIRVNATLCEMLGRQEWEFIGSTSEVFSHPDDLAVTDDFYRHVRNNAAPRA